MGGFSCSLFGYGEAGALTGWLFDTPTGRGVGLPVEIWMRIVSRRC